MAGWQFFNSNGELLQSLETTIISGGSSSDTITYAYREVNTSVAVQSTDAVIGVDTDGAGGALTITMLDAGTNSGRVFHIKRLATKNDPLILLTVAPAGSDTIDGNDSVLMSTEGMSLALMSDGTSDWMII